MNKYIMHILCISVVLNYTGCQHSLPVSVEDETSQKTIAQTSVQSIRIDGTRGNDKIYAGSGDDIVHGMDGNDQIYGLDGNDKLFGENGNDIIHGGNGNDPINGGNGNDIIYGENGNDQLFGNKGNDRLFGGNGNDILNGYEGDDNLYGQNGNDIIEGKNGNDYLDGGNGNDKLNGCYGNDIIYGGPGNDNLMGSRGLDKLFGGPGNDTYVYEKIFPGHTNIDIIQDSGGNDILRTPPMTCVIGYQKNDLVITPIVDRNNNNVVGEHKIIIKNFKQNKCIEKIFIGNSEFNLNILKQYENSTQTIRIKG